MQKNDLFFSGQMHNNIFTKRGRKSENKCIPLQWINKCIISIAVCFSWRIMICI